VISEIDQFDLDDSSRRLVASDIIDLLFFFKTGVGESRDIIVKMRFVLETYCTWTYAGFFDSGDSLADIVEKIRKTGMQHPACALLDELDDIHEYSQEHDRNLDPVDSAASAFEVDELKDFVRRTLTIVNAIPDLP